MARKSYVEKKEERARKEKENAPHVILGTRPGQEDKWNNCDLAKIIVTAEELENMSPPPMTPNGTALAPTHMNYGLDGLDGKESKKELEAFFFDALPQASIAASIEPELVEKMRQWNDLGEDPKQIYERRQIVAHETRENMKASQLARLVDLRNANARGIAFENRRRIVAAFSPTGSAVDSGYPEVQGDSSVYSYRLLCFSNSSTTVALLTLKIRNVWDHLMRSKKDIAGRRSLRQLVHQRAKMLKYIKKQGASRYERILKRTALERESVEGELVV